MHFSSGEMQGPKCAYFSRGVAKVASYEKRLIFHWFFFIRFGGPHKKLQNPCRERATLFGEKLTGLFPAAKVKLGQVGRGNPSVLSPERKDL